MRQKSDPFGNSGVQRLWAYVNLTPFLGIVPSLWTLARGRGSRIQRAASRHSVALALLWLGGSILLNASPETPELQRLSLLFLSGLLTSGYILASFWLMVQLWHHKIPRSPELKALGDRPPKHP